MIFIETNNHKYNMYYIADFQKEGDLQIIFTGVNNMEYIEIYDSSDDRDNAYNKIMNDFVDNVDE